MPVRHRAQYSMSLRHSIRKLQYAFQGRAITDHQYACQAQETIVLPCVFEAKVTIFLQSFCQAQGTIVLQCACQTQGTVVLQCVRHVAQQFCRVSCRHREQQLCSVSVRRGAQLFYSVSVWNRAKYFYSVPVRHMTRGLQCVRHMAQQFYRVPVRTQYFYSLFTGHNHSVVYSTKKMQKYCRLYFASTIYDCLNLSASVSVVENGNVRREYTLLPEHLVYVAHLGQGKVFNQRGCTKYLTVTSCSTLSLYSPEYV